MRPLFYQDTMLNNYFNKKPKDLKSYFSVLSAFRYFFGAIMFELRSYQEECLNTIIDTFETNKRQLVQLPTGAGKTVIFWELLRRMNYKTLIIVPSIQLMHQVREMGWKFGFQKSISCKGGKLRQKINHFHVIISHSLGRKENKNLMESEFDLIICDEAHKAYSDSYIGFFEKYSKKHPNVKILGLTATPERTDAQSLLTIFEKFTFSKEIYDLIDEGHLTDLKAYRIRTEIDLKSHSLNIKGDFTHWSLIKYLDNDKRNTLILDAYRKFCTNRKTLIFCINIDHSRKIANFFNSRDIPACHIDGLMNYEQRKEILEKFRSGKIKVLTNCQLLTEGFDEPSIDALIIARPTRSKVLYTQMIGRGTRLYEGKENCLVLELADNGHKICNFKVLCNLESPILEERDNAYDDGILLSRLFKQKAVIECEIKETVEERFNIFDDSSSAWTNEAFHHQKYYLRSNFIYFIEPINFEEAAFLIWLDMYKKKTKGIKSWQA